VYATFGGVVWSAYEEFGNQSLHNFAPLVMADRAPLKLLPGEGTPDPTGLRAEAASERYSATALARREPPALRQSAAGASLRAREAREADTLVMTAQPAMAPDQAEPVAPVEAPGAGVPVAAALETPSLDVRAAAPLTSAGTAADVLHSGPAATWPAAPAFKPRDAVPIVVAEARLAPPKASTTEASGLGASPPLPSLKPVVMPSEQRPGRDTRLATGPASLPDALRAFWTNLKILLASGPAPRVIPAGNNDRWFDRSEGGGFANATTAGGGRSSSGSSGGGSTSGGSSSGSGGSPAAGGGSSTSSGGGSANGGVSGGGGVSVGGSGKDSRGKGGKDGGRGGRGGGDDDDDD
jgi:hypothetical protein